MCRRTAVKNLYTWCAVLAVVLFSTGGDVLLSHAMKSVGDVGALRRSRGVKFVIRRILRRRTFFFGLACMALAFYSLLFGLSWNDVSLVGPAAASLTFVANAFAARIFLRENVDRRRWMAALFVAGGVFLLTI
ncbi:MAG: EamA family transporter [Acidobacteria bacterium]|nr:EamA family transporter [Acidobacteriota bacterium]